MRAAATRVLLIPLHCLRGLLLDDPFYVLELSETDDFDSYPALSRYRDDDVRDTDDRRTRYDGPRVRFFRDRLRAGANVEPIEARLTERGQILVDDGYHRLCAAFLANVATVAVRL